LNKGYYPGSTDSSFDVFMLSTADARAAKKADDEARALAKKREDEEFARKKMEADKAGATEAKEMPGIAVGDKSQNAAAAAAKEKDGSAFEDPTPEQVAIAAAEGETEKKVKSDPAAAAEQAAAEMAAINEADQLEAKVEAARPVTNATINVTLADEVAAQEQDSDDAMNTTIIDSNTTVPPASNVSANASALSAHVSSAVAQKPLECWEAKPGTDFIYHQINCTDENSNISSAAAAQASREWGQDISGERRPETEGAKLMSVVGPYGCADYLEIGGDKETYWGQLGADERSIPCGPSGSVFYLTPHGAEVQSAINLVREAERIEELAQAAALAAASGGNTTSLEAVRDLKEAWHL